MGKAAGIGDVEGCDLPVALGDYVWLDLDEDGVQDPGEQPLAGVTVTITGGSLSAPLVLTTDANGQWEATALDGLLHGEAYTIVIDPTSTTNLPAGVAVADLMPTTQDATAGTDLNDSDIDPDTLTMTAAALAPGETNHSYDAGFTIPAFYDLALVKTVASGDEVIAPGEDVTFTITVTNQGTLDATTFTITDYIPTGFTLNDSDWTANGTTPTYTAGPLPAGDSVDIDITLTADADITPGDHVNWAEISADDGDDVDSTPNDTQTDDNQPENPGDPTDDVIDNTDEDEDDHDPALVTVANFDLALRKTLQDGSNPTVAIGDTVTWTITVFNQGNVNATNINIIDYLPTGLTLNDTTWTAGTNGTATINIAGPITPGTSTTVDITTTVIDGSDLTNLAEIESADPTDQTGALIRLPNGDPLTDTDSTPDGTNTENPTDNEIGNANGDEDDHDLASITLTPTPSSNPSSSSSSSSTPGLAFTGNSTLPLGLAALGLFLAGATLLYIRNRKEKQTLNQPT